MRRFITLIAVLVFLLCGCRMQTYDDVTFPVQEKSSLVKVGDIRTGSDYHNTETLKSVTEEKFASSDDLCVIEKKADHMEIFLDVEKDGHYNAGKAYGEALNMAVPDYIDILQELINKYKSSSEDEMLISELCEKYEKALSEEYRQELRGFSDVLGNSCTGISDDGGISYEEVLLITTMLNIWNTGSSLAVSGESSVSGKTVTVTVMNCNKNAPERYSCLNSILHIRNGEKELTMICVAGMLASDIILNNAGVEAVVHKLKSDDYKDYSCSLLYAVREALEECSSLSEAEKHIRSISGRYIPANVLLTDENDIICIEAANEETAVRYSDSELLRGIEWNHPDCICVVNAFALKGNPPLLTNYIPYIKKWKRYDRLLDEYGKIDADDLKSLVTAYPIQRNMTNQDIRSMFNSGIAVVDIASGKIHTAFTGKNGPEDIPVFTETGWK